MEIEEVRIVEHRGHDVLDDAVRAVDDGYESSSIDSGEENSFPEDSLTICNARPEDRDVIKEERLGDDFNVRE